MKQTGALQAYLGASHYIDFASPAVAACARELAGDADDEQQLVRNCFEFVRDRIRHSVDFKLNPVTCRASDVLLHGTGYCYAKSHLLAALLRANGIPAGLCYQRLSMHGNDGAFCLHGLNAVFLTDGGWLRLDARGNKPGINARFEPPAEVLAFCTDAPGECDLPEIWPDPLPGVIRKLEAHTDYAALLADLPDIDPATTQATPSTK